MNTLIVIPARFNSSRFPGKPLVKIAGITMIERVYNIAQQITHQRTKGDQIQILVSTEDERILEHCNQRNLNCVLTSETCNTGTERAAMTLEQLTEQPDIVINLQGDNPLCPPWFLTQLIQAFEQYPNAQVVTPFVTLTWPELDQFRQQKEQTPFSGTTVVFNQKLQALWFSKKIIPAIRTEAALRDTGAKSPIARHIGLYGYRTSTLMSLDQLPPSSYEPFEGLEQLRFLENGMNVQMIEVDYQGQQGLSGIDSPEDVQRAEAIIEMDGEHFKPFE